MGEQGTSAAAEPTGAPEFSPQQIAGAVSKVSTSGTWSGVFRACIASIAFCNCCLADEDFKDKVELETSDHNSSSDRSELRIQDLDDSRLQEISVDLAKAITEKLGNDSVRIRKWGKQKITYAIKMPDPKVWAPMSYDATSNIIRNQLNDLGKAAKIDFSEVVAANQDKAELTIDIKPAIPRIDGQPLDSKIEGWSDCESIAGSFEQGPCKTSSKIDDTETHLKIENGQIVASQCKLIYDASLLCEGRTLLTALSDGLAIREACETWSTWRTLSMMRLDYSGDDHDESLPSRLDGCTWSAKRFQSMATAAGNWEWYWRRQLQLCAIQSLGFFWDDPERLANEPRALSMPRIRVGSCLLRDLCVRNEHGDDLKIRKSTSTACSSPVSTMGVREALEAVYGTAAEAQTLSELAVRIYHFLKDKNLQK